jgi:SpoVK/Ycf46/Vps4 family AAA+-type ATPase
MIYLDLNNKKGKYIMAKFKQVPQSFLFDRLLVFFENMVANYRAEVRDDDFFDVVRNCFDHDKAVELIEVAYTEEELEELKNSRSRRGRLDLSDSLDSIFSVLWNNEKSREKCRVVLNAIIDCMRADNKKVKDETIEKRFLELKRILKLSDLEYDIIMVMYVLNQTCFSWPCRIETREKPLYIAMSLDRSYAEILNVLTPKGRLRKFDILDNDWDFNFRSIGNFIDGTNADAIERRFYKKNETAEITPWEYFGDLSMKDGALIKKMLMANPKKCNILLYGAPGTGKTSFARALAKEVGRTAWEIKQGDDDGRNMKSEARMMGIQICNEQESPSESLVIIDEADELLRGGSYSYMGMMFGGGRKSTEKGVVNTILDEMQIPAVWISNNHACEIDESVRRRFDYSICFEELNSIQRMAIWRNIVNKLKLSEIIAESKIEEYAGKYPTNAGGISLVLENVKRLNPQPEKVDELVAALMKPHCKLLNVKDANCFLPAKGYSLEGLNIKGKIGLEKIVRSVRNYYDDSFNASSEDRPRMNLLMFGPPGTGKTEFVKYLGKKLDRKVVVMKGSDILGMYVGESEQNIANAFRRAEREKAVLFFDEIDGLLQSRENAHASWEVTQVNELLQQMENFNGVMVAATNFCQNLDPAVMRRFTFKLEFDYLDDAGKKIFFEKMFKTELSEEESSKLKELTNLAPGDFRTVRQEMFYLGDEITNLDRIAALKEECAHKKDGKKTATIGF